MKNLLLFLLASIIVAPVWAKGAESLSLGVVIELKGSSPEEIATLIAKLKKAPVYKAAACEAANESKIACAKADNRLMGFLSKNAPASVQWSISSADGARPCPGTTGCTIMHCPPPTGPIMCCHSTAPYGPC